MFGTLAHNIISTLLHLPLHFTGNSISFSKSLTPPVLVLASSTAVPDSRDAVVNVLLVVETLASVPGSRSNRSVSLSVSLIVRIAPPFLPLIGGDGRGVSSGILFLFGQLISSLFLPLLVRV